MQLGLTHLIIYAIDANSRGQYGNLRNQDGSGRACALAAMPQKDITGDMLGDFLTYCDVSEKSRQTYRKSLRPFFSWIAQNHITRPQYRDILAYKDAMKEGRKPTTVQAYITAVKLFFSWAEIEGFIPM